MDNLVDLLMVKAAAALFFRNWLLLGVPMLYGLVACV